MQDRRTGTYLMGRVMVGVCGARSDSRPRPRSFRAGELEDGTRLVGHQFGIEAFSETPPVAK